MDIEGAEVKALQGMDNALREFRPVVIIEINPMWTRRMGTSATELLDLLKRYRYRVFDIAFRGKVPQETDLLNWVDPDGEREVNAIALPLEKR